MSGTQPQPQPTRPQGDARYGKPTTAGRAEVVLRNPGSDPLGPICAVRDVDRRRGWNRAVLSTRVSSAYGSRRRPSGPRRMVEWWNGLVGFPWYRAELAEQRRWTYTDERRWSSGVVAIVSRSAGLDFHRGRRLVGVWAGAACSLAHNPCAQPPNQRRPPSVECAPSPNGRPFHLLLKVNPRALPPSLHLQPLLSSIVHPALPRHVGEVVFLHPLLHFHTLVIQRACFHLPRFPEITSQPLAFTLLLL